MSELNENFVGDMLKVTGEDGKGQHAPLTVWEETQLLTAWLSLQAERTLRLQAEQKLQVAVEGLKAIEALECTPGTRHCTAAGHLAQRALKRMEQ